MIKKVTTITGDVLNKYILYHVDRDGNKELVCYTHKDYPFFEMSDYLARNNSGIAGYIRQINHDNHIRFDYGSHFNHFELIENEH